MKRVSTSTINLRSSYLFVELISFLGCPLKFHIYLRSSSRSEDFVDVKLFTLCYLCSSYILGQREYISAMGTRINKSGNWVSDVSYGWNLFWWQSDRGKKDESIFGSRSVHSAMCYLKNRSVIYCGRLPAKKKTTVAAVVPEMGTTDQGLIGDKVARW